MLDCILLLLALAGGCAFLRKKYQLAAGVCPLAVLSVALCLLGFAGMAGLLNPVLWLLQLLGWGLLAWYGVQLARQGGAALAWRGESLGRLLFWGGAVFLLLRLAWLRPELLNFDEYSFWGTACKLMTLSGKLYTECETSLPWQMTECPIIPLASYLVQHRGVFLPWRAIWAVDVLLLAGLAAAVEAAKGTVRRAFPFGIIFLLLPCVMTIYDRTIGLNTLWLEVLGDLPAGVLFGAAAAFWWAMGHKRYRLWWLAVPVLCLAGHIKANTFVLGLAAAGFAALDLFLFDPSGAKTAPAKRYALRAAKAAALLAAPLVQYLAWNRYVAALVQRKAVQGGMGATSEALLTVVVQGTRLFLGQPAAEYYTQRSEQAFAYAAALRELFFTQKVCAFGSGAAVVLVIALLFALAVLLADTGRLRLRTAVCGVASLGCFLAYWYMLLLSYAFVLKDSSPANPASYVRYIQSYYIGWMLLAMAVFAYCAAGRMEKSRGAVLPVLLAAACVGLTVFYVKPQHSVLGAGPGAYRAMRQQQTVAAAAAAKMEEGDRAFLVYQQDDGFYWFAYMNALLPAHLVYGTGGGSFGLAAYRDSPYYQEGSPEEFLALVHKTEATCLLVAYSDAVFMESYADLFEQPELLAAGPVLYRVTENGFASPQPLGGGAA